MPGKSGSHQNRQESHGKGHAALDRGRGMSESKGKGARSTGGGGGGSWDNLPGVDSSAGKQKNGCFPKLLMLSIPFIAAGSFFVIKILG